MRGDTLEVGDTLRILSDTNRLLGLHEEGIQQGKEALEIYERLGDTFGRAHSLCDLAQSLYEDHQLDAAKEAASQSIDLLPERVDRTLACRCHRIIGEIHSSKGEAEQAIDHFEAALRIASFLDWHYEQFWGHYCLAELFFNQGRYDDSHAEVEHAKSHGVNDMYLMGRAMNLQAGYWYEQDRLREAKSEVLCAIDAYEKVGATKDLGMCRDLLRDIEGEIEGAVTSGGSGFNIQ